MNTITITALVVIILCLIFIAMGFYQIGYINGRIDRSENHAKRNQ